MDTLLKVGLPAVACVNGILLAISGLRLYNRAAGIALMFVAGVLMLAAAPIGLVIGYSLGVALHRLPVSDKSTPYVAAVAILAGVFELTIHFIQQPEWFTFPPRVAGFAKVWVVLSVVTGAFTMAGLALSLRSRRGWPLIVAFFLPFSVFMHRWVVIPIGIAFVLGYLDSTRAVAASWFAKWWFLLLMTVLVLAYYLWILELAMSNWYALGGSPFVAAMFSTPAFWLLGATAKAMLWESGREN